MSAGIDPSGRRGRREGAIAVGAAVVAALASLALDRAVPLASADPLRSTVVLLPLVVAGFVLLARGAVRLGARAVSPGAGLAEAIAVGALALLAVGRGHLGIPGVAPVVAAGFALVLAHRVARQAIALRPLLGRRELPALPPWPFFALPLLVYLALLPWSTERRPPDGDEPYYLLITHSLAYDFDADLTDDYREGEWKHFMDRPIGPQPGDPVGPGGELYSRHNEMLPLLLAPSYRLAGKGGALATMAALAAALAWMVPRLARRYPRPQGSGGAAISPSGALAAWALAAFAPPLLLYAGQVWVEVPAALLVAIAIDRIHAPATAGWDRLRWLGIGLPILLLPLLKIRFLLLAAPLLALAWWYGGRPKKPLLVLAGLLALLAAGILVHNQLLYGNPLKIHTWQEVEPTSYGPVDYARGFLGIFWDAAFGLFGAAPIWLLALPALGALAASGHRLPKDLAIVTLPYLAVVAPRSEWYGGWSPPFRYALVMLPLLALALAPFVTARRRPGVRFLWGGLGALTLALALLWIAVPGWTYNFADGKTYLLDHLATRLGLDLARFFPSSVRVRLATWLVPVATALLAGLAFLRGPRRLARGGALAGMGLAGVAGLLALLAALPTAADRIPTRVVEFEDEQVRKRGGHPEPERWVVDRTRFRGSWVLREGESLEAPVVPGGRRLTIRLDGYFVRHHPGRLAVEVRAGGLEMARPAFDRDQVWETVTIGPLDWPAGSPLAIVLPPADPPLPAGQMANGILFDRAELEWE